MSANNTKDIFLYRFNSGSDELIKIADSTGNVIVSYDESIHENLGRHLAHYLKHPSLDEHERLFDQINNLEGWENAREPDFASSDFQTDDDGTEYDDADDYTWECLRISRKSLAELLGEEAYPFDDYRQVIKGKVLSEQSYVRLRLRRTDNHAVIFLVDGDNLIPLAGQGGPLGANTIGFSPHLLTNEGRTAIWQQLHGLPWAKEVTTKDADGALWFTSGLPQENFSTLIKQAVFYAQPRLAGSQLPEVQRELQAVIDGLLAKNLQQTKRSLTEQIAQEVARRLPTTQDLIKQALDDFNLDERVKSTINASVSSFNLITWKDEIEQRLAQMSKRRGFFYRIGQLVVGAGLVSLIYQAYKLFVVYGVI